MSEIDVKIGPGHEFDIIVAEKVMGWTDWRIWPPDQPAVKPPGENSRPFSPSTEISAAMEVVARMRNDWFSFKAWQPSKMPYNPGDPPLEIAVVSFICGMGPCTRHGTTHHNHHGAYDVEGETLPMAICKAALIALKKG